MMNIVRAVAVLFLVQAVHAQTQPQAQTPALKGPAIAELQAAAENSSAAAAQLDGAKAKTSKDGTVVVDSRRETYVRNVPPSRECDYSDAGMDGRMRPYHNCFRQPGYREEVVADIQTVKVADRKAFTSSRMKTGALIGGAIGLLGFFALFAGPIGWAIGAAAVVAGAAIGAGIGYATAKNTPDTFERTKERSSRRL